MKKTIATLDLLGLPVRVVLVSDDDVCADNDTDALGSNAVALCEIRLDAEIDPAYMQAVLLREEKEFLKGNLAAPIAETQECLQAFVNIEYAVYKTNSGILFGDELLEAQKRLTGMAMNLLISPRHS